MSAQGCLRALGGSGASHGAEAGSHPPAATDGVPGDQDSESDVSDDEDTDDEEMIEGGLDVIDTIDARAEPSGARQDTGGEATHTAEAPGDRQDTGGEAEEEPDPEEDGIPLPPEVGDEALRADAKSLAHLLTHKPFNKYCEACQAAKMRDVKHFRGHLTETRRSGATC